MFKTFIKYISFLLPVSKWYKSFRKYCFQILHTSNMDIINTTTYLEYKNCYIHPSTEIYDKMNLSMGDNCWLGGNCFIGAGAVVTKSVPKCAIITEV